MQTVLADEFTSGAGTADIDVAGTLFRWTNTRTPSPLTVPTADDLARRGINNVRDAVSLLSSTGAGDLSNGFSASDGPSPTAQGPFRCVVSDGFNARALAVTQPEPVPAWLAAWRAVHGQLQPASVRVRSALAKPQAPRPAPALPDRRASSGQQG